MWGTFPMERPCSSISFPSRPSLGWEGACDHPPSHVHIHPEDPG